MFVGPAWRRPGTWAVASLVFAVPTLVFVGASLLAYQVAVPGMAERIDPLVTGVLNSPLAELLLAGGPLVALVTAVAPLVSYAPGERRGAPPTISLRLLWPNAAASALSLGLVLVVGLYGLSEAAIEAAR